jgi:hypothetical protein
MDWVYIVLMIVILIRGYYLDIKNGQFGWFLIRIILVTAVYFFAKEISKIIW